MLRHHFNARINDKRKVGLDQVYLGTDKLTVTCIEAKQAIEKVYHNFGEASLFNDLYSQLSLSLPTPVQ